MCIGEQHDYRLIPGSQERRWVTTDTGTFAKFTRLFYCTRCLKQVRA